MKAYNYEEALAAIESHPYLVTPAVAALSTATAEERQTLVRRIAAAVCNEEDLRAIIGMDPAEFADFYPDTRPREISTSDTIDTFLEKFSTPEKSATPELETLVTAPAIDYAAVMLDQEDATEPGAEEEDDPTASMISSFLNAVPPKTVKKKEPTPKPEPKAETQPTQHDDADLSESLAKMMIKNGNYRKALEIITDLSLKNPKKSIYFADQMRFLKKLIQNQQKSGEGIADN